MGAAAGGRPQAPAGSHGTGRDRRALVPPLEPLSRNRTSQLTGNRARRRAVGCVREQEREGGGQEGVHPGQQGVRRCKGPGLPRGLDPSRIWGPGVSQTAVLLASGGGSRCPCHAPPPHPASPRTKAQGTQPWAETPREGEQSSRSGPDRPGQWPVGQLLPVHLSCRQSHREP